MMRIIALAAAAAIAAQPAFAQQATDAPLRPAGAWGIDYGENVCTLSRTFGTGEGQVSLGFIPLTGGGTMKIVLIGMPNNGKSGGGQATISAGTGEAMHRFYYSTTDTKLGKPITMIRSARYDLKKIGASNILTIRTKRQHVSFALVGFEAALKALDACETDLAKTWGVDMTAIVTPAKPISPGTWMKSEDYPETAMDQHDAGETGFRLAVGVDGKPTGCVVMVKSISPTLDERACTVMMRSARFTPAVGADGKPVPGVFANSVMWMLGAGHAF